MPVPWRRVWTSRQFLIACVAASGNDWGFHTLITLGPKYMKENLGLDLEQLTVAKSSRFELSLRVVIWSKKEPLATP
uniref:Uncharacterized protein n=1 Tax=Timema poppense TaxID=170557 RepID=A0A7R9DMW1_TIMPO|nr:unnamed protein product [Timema poppensis]